MWLVTAGECFSSAGERQQRTSSALLNSVGESAVFAGGVGVRQNLPNRPMAWSVVSDSIVKKTTGNRVVGTWREFRVPADVIGCDWNGPK